VIVALIPGFNEAPRIGAVIEAARHSPPPMPELAPQPELARDLRPVVPLITAWINQLAGELDLDPALLGTRADVEAALRGDEGGRLSTGWRADLLGEPIRQLVGGHAALAYDAGRGLVLDERNRT